MEEGYKFKKKNNILINQIYYPVKTLGFGNRVGIWFQGCSIHCPGCMSQYTWDFDKKYEMSFRFISDTIKKMMEYQPEGFTISGGEPFDQPDGLMSILKLCHLLRCKEILVYSGYEYEHLASNFADILEHIDILICGPYLESMTTEKIWRGSDNQRLTLLSERSKAKYINLDLDNQLSNKKDSIQFCISNDTIFLIGIPRRGDLNKLESQCIKRGFKICQR